MQERRKSRRIGHKVEVEETQTQEQPPQVKRNDHPFPNLPAELLLLTVSHLPSLPRHHYRNYHDGLPPECSEAFRITRLLSQMCRNLRRVFFPFTWTSIHVCSSMAAKTGKTWQSAWAKDMATALIGQIETVTVRVPTLAQYVRTLDIVITQFSLRPVLRDLAQCISLLPNLQNVQIWGVPLAEGGVSKHAAAVFLNSPFSNPNVTSLSVPKNLSSLRLLFPNLRSLHCTTSAYPPAQLSSPPLRHLEVLRGYTLDQSLADLAEGMPNLQTVMIYPHDCYRSRKEVSVFLEPLLHLKLLRIVEISIGYGGDYPDSYLNVDFLIARTKDVLKEIKNRHLQKTGASSEVFKLRLLRWTTGEFENIVI